MLDPEHDQRDQAPLQDQTGQTGEHAHPDRGDGHRRVAEHAHGEQNRGGTHHAASDLHQQHLGDGRHVGGAQQTGDQTVGGQLDHHERQHRQSRHAGQREADQRAERTGDRTGVRAGQQADEDDRQMHRQEGLAQPGAHATDRADDVEDLRDRNRADDGRERGERLDLDGRQFAHAADAHCCCHICFPSMQAQFRTRIRRRGR